MIIKIDDDYQVATEHYQNVILQKLVRDKSGKTKMNKKEQLQFKNIGYYSTVEAALTVYSHQTMIDKTLATDLPGYIKLLRVERIKLQRLLNSELNPSSVN